MIFIYRNGRNLVLEIISFDHLLSFFYLNFYHKIPKKENKEGLKEQQIFLYLCLFSSVGVRGATRLRPMMTFPRVFQRHLQSAYVLVALIFIFLKPSKFPHGGGRRVVKRHIPPFQGTLIDAYKAVRGVKVSTETGGKYAFIDRWFLLYNRRSKYPKVQKEPLMQPYYNPFLYRHKKLKTKIPFLVCV